MQRDDTTPKNDPQARPRARQGRRALIFALSAGVGALAVLACVLTVSLVLRRVDPASTERSGEPLDDTLVGAWELDRTATVQFNTLFRRHPEMISYEFRKDGDGIRAADGERQSVQWTLLDKQGDTLLLQATFEGSKEATPATVVLIDKDHIRLTYTNTPTISYVLKRSAAGELTGPELVRPLLSLDTGLDGNQLDRGVRALAVSADGRVVVAQGKGRANRVVVWNVAQPRQRHEFPNPSLLWERPVAVSADGKVLAYPTGLRDVEDIVLRDVESGKELRRLKRKDSDIQLVHGLAFSPAGDLLVAAADREVVGWDPRTGEQRFAWEGDDELVTALSAFFNAGKKIASGGNGGTVKVWDVATGQLVCTLAEEDGGAVTSITASEDGKMLVSAAYTDVSRPLEPILVWDVAAGKVVKRLPARGSNKVAVLPDGKTLIYDNLRKVYMDDIETGVRRHVLQGHESYVSCLALTPDGSRLVTGSPDKTIKVWDLKAIPKERKGDADRDADLFPS